MILSLLANLQPVCVSAGRGLHGDRSQRMMLGVPGPARAPANHLPLLSKHQELQAPFGHLSPDLPLGFFVFFNEHRVVGKCVLCSTKGNSDIIRNDYIPALGHYCCY